MKRSLLIGLLALVTAVSGVYGYGQYTSISSRNRADKVVDNIMNLNLSSVYDSMSEAVKGKYKNKEEFVEKFPLYDTMNPENEKRFLTKSVNNRLATYDYFLPNEDKPSEGHRISIVVAYSPFDKGIRDIRVQEDTAPIQ